MLALTRTAGSALARLLGRFFEVREVPAGRSVFHDWLEVALLSTVFVLGAVTAPWNASGQANAPLDGWLHEHTGGGLCIFKRVTGIECPGCGLSRGFVQIEHGNVVEAIKLNPLTPVIFLLLMARLAQRFIRVASRRDVQTRMPWWLAWKLYGTLGASYALLGVYRVTLRFM